MFETYLSHNDVFTDSIFFSSIPINIHIFGKLLCYDLKFTCIYLIVSEMVSVVCINFYKVLTQ